MKLLPLAESQKPCLKCGTEEWKEVYFIIGDWDIDYGTRAVPKEDEFIRWRCRCGFQIDTKTADACKC